VGERSTKRWNQAGFAQRVYESGRRCAEVDAKDVIGKTDGGKRHRLYGNFILRSLARHVLR